MFLASLSDARAAVMALSGPAGRHPHRDDVSDDWQPGLGIPEFCVGICAEVEPYAGVAFERSNDGGVRVELHGHASARPADFSFEAANLGRVIQ